MTTTTPMHAHQGLKALAASKIVNADLHHVTYQTPHVTRSEAVLVYSCNMNMHKQQANKRSYFILVGVVRFIHQGLYYAYIIAYNIHQKLIGHPSYSSNDHILCTTQISYSYSTMARDL